MKNILIFFVLLLICNLYSNSLDLISIINGNLASENISLASLGVDSGFFNPASMALIEYNEIKLIHLSYIADISQESVAIGIIPDQFSGLGVALNYIHTEIEYNREDYTGIKNDGYLSGKLSYGYNLGGGIITGLAGKIGFNISSSKYSISTFWGIDAGFILEQILLPYSSLEFYLENIFSSAKEEKMFSFYTGFLYNIIKEIYASLGYQYFMNSPDNIAIGLQFEPIYDILFIKLGYKRKIGNTEDGFLNGLSIGVSFKENPFKIEYNMIPLFNFSSIVHKFSISFYF